MITIPYRALKAISLFAAKNDVRFYLNGVLVDSAGNEVRLVATNGHHLGVIRLPHDTQEPGFPEGRWILDNDSVKTLLTLAPKKSQQDTPFLLDPRTLESEHMQAKHGNSTASVHVIDAPFPNYLRVIPRQVSGEASQFQPSYLAVFEKADRILGQLEPSRVDKVVVHYNGLGGALVECRSSPWPFVGVLMPRKYDVGNIDALVAGLPKSTRSEQKTTL